MTGAGGLTPPAVVLAAAHRARGVVTTENYRERLAGSDTDEVYLTSGTYHLLADLLELGWHPEYATLIKEAEEA